MKLMSAHIEDLKTLYIANLRKALDLETKIVEKGLPGMIAHTSDSQLAAAFRTHLEESRGHQSKVKSLLQKHTGEAKTETCDVIDGLITEAQDTIKDVTSPEVRDIALIGGAQQVEHHEIAVYGTIRRWAEILGLDSDVTVLKSIEAEEGAADKKLTQISQTVNSETAMA